MLQNSPGEKVWCTYCMMNVEMEKISSREPNHRKERQTRGWARWAENETTHTDAHRRVEQRAVDSDIAMSLCRIGCVLRAVRGKCCSWGQMRFSLKSNALREMQMLKQCWMKSFRSEGEMLTRTKLITEECWRAININRNYMDNEMSSLLLDGDRADSKYLLKTYCSMNGENIHERSLTWQKTDRKTRVFNRISEEVWSGMEKFPSVLGLDENFEGAFPTLPK